MHNWDKSSVPSDGVRKKLFTIGETIWFEFDIRLNTKSHKFAERDETVSQNNTRFQKKLCLYWSCETFNDKIIEVMAFESVSASFRHLGGVRMA